MAVPVARGVTPAGVTLGLCQQAWLIEAGGLANRSEGLGWPGLVNKSKGFRWAGLAQGPSIRVRGWEGLAGPGPVDKGEGLWGRAAPGPANRSEGFWGYGPRGQGQPAHFLWQPSCNPRCVATKLWNALLRAARGS